MKSSKTKWRPMYVYSAINSHSLYMVYARYDHNTGLFEFKTSGMIKNIHGGDMPVFHCNPQKVLDELMNESEVK